MEAHMRKSYLAVLVLTAALAGALLVPPATSAQNTGWPVSGCARGNTHWTAPRPTSSATARKPKAPGVCEGGTRGTQESTPLVVADALYVPSWFGARPVLAVVP